MSAWEETPLPGSLFLHSMGLLRDSISVTSEIAKADQSTGAPSGDACSKRLRGDFECNGDISTVTMTDVAINKSGRTWPAILAALTLTISPCLGQVTGSAAKVIADRMEIPRYWPLASQAAISGEVILRFAISLMICTVTGFVLLTYSPQMHVKAGSMLGQPIGGLTALEP